MRLKAVLGIKDCAGRKIRKYRIIDEDTGQIKDIPIKTIIETIKIKDINIEGLKFQDNKFIETYKIPAIPEVRESSISLYQWCQQHGERGQRILKEFEFGNNYPITAHDVSKGTDMKMKFSCTTCQKISKQAINNKTSEHDCKCKFCAGQINRGKFISLYEWSLQNGDYGKQVLNEYIQGNNPISPDKILYASTQKASFKCSNCGSVNYERIKDRTSQKRKHCILCDKHKTSFGEQLILKWLQSQGLQAISQHQLTSEVGSKYFDIYLPQLNLLIEHQSGMHNLIEKQFTDETGELIAQQNSTNLLEVCELESRYYRTENKWCITYEEYNKHQMINKIQQWLFKNYNIHLSNIIPAEVGRSAWRVKFPIKYEDSLAYIYPEVAAQFIPKLNYGFTPDLIPHNSGYKFWLQGPQDTEPKYMYLYSRTKKYKKKQ